MLENQTVTIWLDLSTDLYRQFSYLEISVCFTDEKYQFLTYDLCCSPLVENVKTASNIIIPRVSPVLSIPSVSLFPGLTKVSSPSDREASFVTTLKPYATTNCVTDRSKTVVKVGFYQTSKTNLKNSTTISYQTLQIMPSSDFENDTDRDEDDQCYGKNKTMNISSTPLNILKSIVSCEWSVRHIKGEKQAHITVWFRPV